MQNSKNRIRSQEGYICPTHDPEIHRVQRSHGKNPRQKIRNSQFRVENPGCRPCKESGNRRTEGSYERIHSSDY